MAPSTTELYTLSLHDALPISPARFFEPASERTSWAPPSNSSRNAGVFGPFSDRKSTRLNSSHRTRSYAVFCLKKKTRHGAGTHEALAAAALQAEGGAGLPGFQ